MTDLCGDILSRFHVFCRGNCSVFNNNLIETMPQRRVLHSDFGAHAAMSRAISGNGNTTTKKMSEGCKNNCVNIWQLEKKAVSLHRQRGGNEGHDDRVATKTL